MPLTPQLLSINQAAELLEVSRRTVHRRVVKGLIPAIKMSGQTGAYLIDRADIEAILTSSYPVPARAS